MQYIDRADVDQEIQLHKLVKGADASVRRDFIRARLVDADGPPAVSIHLLTGHSGAPDTSTRSAAQRELFGWANRTVEPGLTELRGIRRALRYIQATYQAVDLRSRALDILVDLVLGEPTKAEIRDAERTKRPKVTAILDTAVRTAGNRGLTVDELVMALGKAGHSPARPRATVTTWLRRAESDNRVMRTADGRITEVPRI